MAATFLCVAVSANDHSTVSGQLYESAYDDKNFLITNDSLILLDQNLLNEEIKSALRRSGVNGAIEISSLMIKEKWKFLDLKKEKTSEVNSKMIKRKGSRVDFSARKSFSWNNEQNIFQSGNQIFEITVGELESSLKDELNAVSVGQQVSLSVPSVAFKSFDREYNKEHGVEGDRNEILSVYGKTLFIVGTLMWTGDDKLFGIQSGPFFILAELHPDTFWVSHTPPGLGEKVSVAIHADEVFAILQDNRVLDVKSLFKAPLERRISSIRPRVW